MDGQNEFGGYDGDGEGNDGSQSGSQGSGGGLRKQLEDALAKLKAAEKRAADAEGAVAKQTAGKVFDKFEVPEKARNLYSGEMSEEAITKWVTEYADIIGVTVGGESQENTDTAAAHQAVQAASAAGFDGVRRSLETLHAEAQSKLTAGSSEAELDEAIAAMFKQ